MVLHLIPTFLPAFLLVFRGTSTSTCRASLLNPSANVSTHGVRSASRSFPLHWRLSFITLFCSLLLSYRIPICSCRSRCLSTPKTFIQHTTAGLLVNFHFNLGSGQPCRDKILSFIIQHNTMKNFLRISVLAIAGLSSIVQVGMSKTSDLNMTDFR
jgi:hypothetical protein